MRILIVDDSSYMRSTLRATLEAGGFEVVGDAKDGESAIDLALELVPDVITLDNVLPDMTGIDVLRALKSKKSTSKVIMISAVGQQSAIAESLAIGAQNYLVKPFDDRELIEILGTL